MDLKDNLIIFIDNAYLKKDVKVILYCLINKSRNFFLSNHLLSICNEVKLINNSHFN